MSAKQDAEEFARDLGKIQTKVEDEAHAYKDMTPEGKRKCMDDLENAIQTLRKIKKNLKEADDGSFDKNFVQVVLPGGWHQGLVSLTTTKEEIEKAFKMAITRLYPRPQPSCEVPPVPCIKSVEMQDNFKLDQNKNLLPQRMCFIKFSTEAEASMALGLKKIYTRIEHNSVHFNTEVELICPTHSMDTYKTLRTIGNSLARLQEIDVELKKIGAIRRQCGMPELGPTLIDKSWYLAKLQEAKKIRASGHSLDLQIHGPLTGTKPVDTEALKLSIKQLYDEECDILIMLREYQLNGMDFEFRHPAY